MSGSNGNDTSLGSSSNKNSDIAQTNASGFQQALAEFEDLVIPRRKAAGILGDQDGSWGLALSGGGIRSATFCLGLLRGLAKNGILIDFDYLSTVSGGGYIGASLGRLYSKNENSALVVQDGVAKENSMWLWWLRNNGRYLTPSGAKDLWFAIASIIRGILATHGELGVLILLMAALALFPHLLVTLIPPTASGSLWSVAFLGQLGSMWWWLMVIPLFGLAHTLFAYWFTRENPSFGSRFLSGVGSLACLSGAAYWVEVASSSLENKRSMLGISNYNDVALSWLVAIILVAPFTGWVISLIESLRGVLVANIRLKRTKDFAYCLWILGSSAMLGALDYLSWWLAGLFREAGLLPSSYGISAFLLLTLAVGRVVLPHIQAWLSSTKKEDISIDRALHIVGIVAALIVALLWTTVLHAFLLPPSVWENGLKPGQDFWEQNPQLLHWMILSGAMLLYVAATRKNFELLNLASLHNYYRSRIERAYVSSGNSSSDQARFPESPLCDVNREMTLHIAPLMEVVKGDDIDLCNYQPHTCGGPIHLINCCINQSVDDRTGIYNADRKGVSLVVSAFGIETGTHLPQLGRYIPPGSLSQWIAISGAAASTGMGSRTSMGLASLLFMSGLRLGYWTQSLLGESKDKLRSGSFRNILFNWMPKPFAILAESLARFPGLNAPLWYLSDGGHFDNTGIYALLKRRPKVIVAADCGADPKYLFGDLESLVRKAKIDYGATIEFLDVGSLNAVVSNVLSQYIGTPETISSTPSSHCLVLGRIRYEDGQIGTLLVVKPCRLESMPFDIVAYADRNPDFPQQTTSDQFFDEAQWESYHQLGFLIGKKLTRDVIAAAKLGVAETTSTLSSLSAALAASVPQQPKNRRDRLGINVRTSIGAGISLSMLLAVWQGIEQYRESRRADYNSYINEYNLLMGRINNDDFKNNIEVLQAGDFYNVFKNSKSLDDGRYEQLLKRLNVKCSEATIPKTQKLCESLYGQLVANEPAYYDYWLADSKRLISLTARSSEPINIYQTTTWRDGDSEANDACSRQGDTDTHARVFLHIYDEVSRPTAIALADKIAAIPGLSRPPIENVTATSQRYSRSTPYVWSKPAIVYHRDVTSKCLELLRLNFSQLLTSEEVILRDLPASLQGVPGSLEVWLPPRSISKANSE